MEFQSYMEMSKKTELKPNTKNEAANEAIKIESLYSSYGAICPHQSLKIIFHTTMKNIKATIYWVHDPEQSR